MRSSRRISLIRLMTATKTTRMRNEIPTRRPVIVEKIVHMIQSVSRVQYAVSAVCLMTRDMTIIV